MSSEKIIAVVGAQGGSAARFILEHMLCVLLLAESSAAKELAANGAEVVQADWRYLTSLENVFTGAYGVFGVTNCEITQGKLLVDAPKATGLKHFIWSTLDNTPSNLPLWEGNHQVDEYLKKSDIGRTSLYTSFYFENFVIVQRVDEDGSYDFPLPFITDAPFGVYSVAETELSRRVYSEMKSFREWVQENVTKLLPE